MRFFGATLWLCRPYGTRFLFLSPLTRPSRAALPHHCSASTHTLTAGGDAADTFCFGATLWLCRPYGTRFLFLSPLTRPSRAALPHHRSAYLEAGAEVPLFHA